MSRHMKRTTVRLNDKLLEDAKQEARRRGKTLTALIEEGLRNELANSDRKGRQARIRLPAGRCGPAAPGLDLSSNASVQEFLDEGVPRKKLR
jgi:Ribbon-helix-helix protein, copG family